MSEPRGLLLASTFSDRQIGGVSSLLTHLAGAVSDARWTWIVRRDSAGTNATRYQQSTGEGRRQSGPIEVRGVCPVPGSRPLLTIAEKAALQPGGSRISPMAFGAAYNRSLRLQWPDGVDAVLWAGTGIELLSYLVRSEARRRHAPFAVLPALHPGQWGDSSVDIPLYRGADAVLALSAHEAGRLAAAGVSDSRIHQLPVGPTVRADGDGARARRALGIGERPLVAFVGRRIASKGLPAVAEAVRVLRAGGSDCVLAVAGPGALDLPDHAGVIDLGTCTEQEKADLMAACDVFAMPSSSESLGLVYVDAWSYGKPVIAGCAPAVRELVNEGIDGFCVDNDPQAVASPLQALLSDERLRRAVGASGLARQRASLTWGRARSTLLRAWGLD